MVEKQYSVKLTKGSIVTLLTGLKFYKNFKTTKDYDKSIELAEKELMAFDI